MSAQAREAVVVDGLGSGEQLLEALQAEVLRPGSVFEGFRGVAVTEDPTTGLTVLFRWCADPTTYAVSVPVETTPSGAVAPVSVWTGLPVESLQEWVQGVAGWLGEEVGTGLVRRARRTRRSGVVHLDVTGSPDVVPAGYDVGHVHLGPGGDGGRHLTRVGLDVRTPRRALRERRLVTWRHAYVNNARGGPVVGHAVITWAVPWPRDPGGRVRVEVLEVVAGTPGAVAAVLAFQALRDAADAGALEAVTALGGAALAEVGFSGPGPDGQRVLALAELQPPDVQR